MADRKTFVIVGAGMAGAKAAETLREEAGTFASTARVADQAAAWTSRQVSIAVTR